MTQEQQNPAIAAYEAAHALYVALHDAALERQSLLIDPDADALVVFLRTQRDVAKALADTLFAVAYPPLDEEIQGLYPRP